LIVFVLALLFKPRPVIYFHLLFQPRYTSVYPIIRFSRCVCGFVSAPWKPVVFDVDDKYCVVLGDTWSQSFYLQR